MIRRIILIFVISAQVVISVAQVDKRSFLVTKIDSSALAAYYIVTAIDIKDTISRDLFLEKDRPLLDSVAHYKKIAIGRCYFFEVYHIYSFILTEDKQKRVILPHAPFYVGKRLISTTSYRPFEVWNTIDLYIKQEDCLDSCYFKSNRK